MNRDNLDGLCSTIALLLNGNIQGQDPPDVLIKCMLHGLNELCGFKNGEIFDPALVPADPQLVSSALALQWFISRNENAILKMIKDIVKTEENSDDAKVDLPDLCPLRDFVRFEALMFLAAAKATKAT